MLTPTDWWHANPFDNWAWYFVGLTPIMLLDYLLIAQFGARARWFQLHTMVNALICVACWPEMLEVLQAPSTAVLETTTNAWGSILAFCLHLYHALFFRLSVTDQYHHAFSVFLCMPFSIMLRTKVLSLIFFQSTGLPGGIDYALLTLVKHRRLDKLLEKQYNAWLNAYLRAPLGAIAAFLTMQVVLHSTHATQRQGAAVLATIVLANSTVFGKMAVENHAVTRVLTEQQTSATATATATAVDRVAVPPRPRLLPPPERFSFTDALTSALLGKFHHLRLTTVEVASGVASTATTQLAALSYRIRPHRERDTN